MKTVLSLLFVFGFISFSQKSSAQSKDSLKGTYQAILEHEQNAYYQFATITLNSVNTGDGNLRVSASVRVLFGDQNSNEFLTYDYPDCALNILTRQISIKDPKSGVSFIGFLKDGGIKGDWYSPVVGRVGAFSATKNGSIPVPPNLQLIRSVTGYYVGKIKNTNSASNLPENVTVTLVTSQDPVAVGTNILIGGNLRLYFGDITSTEYVETKFSSTDFNFYSRFLTAKTANYGITLKGTIGLDGAFKGDVYADGVGHVGTISAVTQ